MLRSRAEYRNNSPAAASRAHQIVAENVTLRKKVSELERLLHTQTGLQPRPEQETPRDTGLKAGVGAFSPAAIGHDSTSSGAESGKYNCTRGWDVHHREPKTHIRYKLGSNS